jgi:predicted dehydrogenase
MKKPVKVGVIGMGAISGAYLGMAKNFPIVEIVACADMNLEAARKKAAEFGISRVCSVDEILADDSIELILNLTIPKAHVPIALRAIAAGKHTYAEKPLGIDREEARRMLDAAATRKLRVGCAPDTFLGAGVQTARKVIEDGTIGKPVACTTFMMCRGHEAWHPNPQFYYEKGGGPMFDMGPYYLTALLNLLGPVKRISGMTAIEIPDRTITSEPKKGTKISVETPDHVCGLMEFEGGAIGTIIQTFATRFAEFGGPNKQPITIFGTEGTLRVPDPNQFDGPLHIRLVGDDEWREVPQTFVKGYGRSVGLADMAYAIRSGRPHRCSAEQAFAVLDLMAGFQDSSDSGKAHVPSTKYQKPAPMPAHLPFGTLDD